MANVKQRSVTSLGGNRRHSFYEEHIKNFNRIGNVLSSKLDAKFMSISFMCLDRRVEISMYTYMCIYIHLILHDDVLV